MGSTGAGWKSLTGSAAPSASSSSSIGWSRLTFGKSSSRCSTRASAGGRFAQTSLAKDSRRENLFVSFGESVQVADAADSGWKSLGCESRSPVALCSADFSVTCANEFFDRCVLSVRFGRWLRELVLVMGVFFAGVGGPARPASGAANRPSSESSSSESKGSRFGDFVINDTRASSKS